MSTFFHKTVSIAMFVLAVVVGGYFYGIRSVDVTVNAREGQEEIEADLPKFVLTARVTQVEDTVKEVAETTPSFVEQSNNERTAIFSTSAFARTDWSPPPNISAQIAMVGDLDVPGHSYFKVGETKRWPLASITKLMTAVVAQKLIHADEIIRLVESDFALGGNLHTAELAAGSAYRAEDLVRLMLVSSSNTSAKALMRTVGEDEFLRAMNTQAAQWGLSDTHFSDPAGVYASNQSTAKDLAILAKRLYIHYLDLLQITGQSSVVMIDAVTGEQKVFESTNRFSGTAGFIGGKTGQTPEARENLISLFTYDNEPLFVLVLGSKQRFIDTELLYNWFKHDFISSN